MATRRRPARARGKKQPEPPPEDSEGTPSVAVEQRPAKRTARRRQGSVAMEQATPRVGVTGRGGRAPATKVPPPPAYWLVFVRDRWDVIGGQVIPALSKAKLQPGANGCGADRNRRPLPAAMLAQLDENGHFVIPWDVDGPGTSYLRRDKATGGWFSRFEKVFPGSDVIHSDTEGYAAWVRTLIDRGVLPPAPIYVIEGLISRYQGLRQEEAKLKNELAVEQHDATIKALFEELKAANDEEEQEASELAAAADDDSGDDDPNSLIGDESIPDTA